MKRTIVLATAVMLCSTLFSQTKPASVFITAGQSNADGREYVNKLPSYLKNGYKYLKYKNVTSSSNGQFEQFKFDKRFAFCDITNYFIEQALQTEFYAVKCAYGGTAIDTAATYAHLPVWCSDEEWLSRNNAYRGDIETGKSLAKSLTEGFADCVDGTLNSIPGGYDVKAIMWHQGESDRSKSSHYYKNFKDMINFMRKSVYEKTGMEKDLTLPFIFGTVSHNSKQYSKEVEEAQMKVAAELPNVYAIDMSDAGLRSDVLHFDSAWTEYLGKQMFNKLVELGLVDGKPLEVEKPHIPSVSDTLEVDIERSWTFSAPWEDEDIDAISSDEKWPMFQSIGYRYSSAMSSWSEAATSDGHVFIPVKGLYFNCGSGNRLILNPGKHMCMYGDNLYMQIPKVSPGQTIIVTTQSAKGERGITAEPNNDLILLSGGVRSADRMTNKWIVSKDAIEPIDVVLHSDGGAIYVYDIKVTSATTSMTIPSYQNTDTDSHTYNICGIPASSNTSGIIIRDGKKYCQMKK